LFWTQALTCQSYQGTCFYSFYQISTWNHLLKLLKPLVVNNFF